MRAARVPAGQGSPPSASRKSTAQTRRARDREVPAVVSKPVRLDPGKYTVVLEPTAVGDWCPLLATVSRRRSAEQGQSFLSKRAAEH